ncbi:MAG: hypothetical protein JWN56_1423 [Sphingobacteriales bacterium]|nr:hypothetical protein [Sphingobacteriales bacterium]
MIPGVSVLICTYNGAERLSETIRYLFLQEVSSDIPWEIVLVNNASTDNTVETAKYEISKYPDKALNFRIVEQLIPGKINAVKKGFCEARFEFIILCDDDNWLYPSYIQLANEIMLSDNLIAVIGGFGIYEPEKPSLKEIEGFERYYVNGPQEWASTQHWVYGAGAVYRKSVFIDLINNEWQLITTSRTSNKLNGGEDVEFCFIAYLKGHKIIADNRLKFLHFVPLKRQKVAYIINLNFWQSYSNVLLNSYFAILYKYEQPFKTIINKWLLTSFIVLIKQLAFLGIYKIKTFNRLTIKQKIDFQSSFGTFCALINNRKKIIDHHKHIIKLLIDIQKPMDNASFTPLKK